MIKVIKENTFEIDEREVRKAVREAIIRGAKGNYPKLTEGVDWEKTRLVLVARSDEFGEILLLKASISTSSEN